MREPDAEPTAEVPALKLQSNCPPEAFEELLAAFIEGLNAAALENIAAMAKDAEIRAIAIGEAQFEQARVGGRGQEN